MNQPVDPVAEALKALKSAGAAGVQVPQPRNEQSQVGRSAARKRRRGTNQTQPTRYDGRADLSYRDPRKFGDLLRREFDRHGWGDRIAISQIMNAWEELVGERIAEHTRPTTYDEKHHVLTIQCDSTSWATQLRYMQTQILQAITRKVGPNVVEQVKILDPNNRKHKPGKLRVKGRGPRDDFG